MYGGAWWATVHVVAKSWIRLSDFPFTFHFHALEKEMATTPVFLPGESQGWGSLVGCPLWGPTESDRTDLAAGIQKHCITILSKTFSLLADCLSMDSNCTT